MVVTLGQQYNVGEKKPTVILNTYIVVTKSTKVNGYVIPVAYSSLNVCMYGQHFQQCDMDQPGVVARTSSEEVKRG